MNTVKIFIAGAKNLKEQRLRMKALANDLNSKYNRRKITINMRCYEDFGEKQSDYNRFIEKEADMIIFIIDGHIGKTTEKEFRLSFELLKKNKRPKILTFMHTFSKRTEDIDHAEEIINNLSDDYYVDYVNTEDLLAKAKERIDSFVRTKAKYSYSYYVSKGLKLLGITFLLLFLLGGGILLSSLTNTQEQVTLNVSDLPVSLSDAGVTKDFIKQFVAEAIPEINNEANGKLNSILTELKHQPVDANGNGDNKGIYIGADVGDITISTNTNSIIRKLRKTFGKKDLTVNMKFLDTDCTYVAKITMDDWRNKHYVKTLEARKSNFPNPQKCAVSCIKKGVAYIISAYSPVVSTLFDYEQKEGLSEYEMVSPWKNNLYQDAEREKILQECITDNIEGSHYSHLILANYYEHVGSIDIDSVLIKKSCEHYRLFGANNKSYAQSINERINFLKDICKQEYSDEKSDMTIPERLIEKGVIPSNTRCQQLIAILNQEQLWDNGEDYFKATLYSFEKQDGKWKEKFAPFKVNLGIKGIALPNMKKEGDLTTPSGFYPIPFTFGYKKDIETKMDFVVLNKDHVWVCDPSSDQYNKLIEDKEGLYKKNPKNEVLRRTDHLYKYCIVVDYNNNPVIKGKGSAIFMHVERNSKQNTAGCISFPEKEMVELIKWMDPSKSPYAYISRE